MAMPVNEKTWSFDANNVINTGDHIEDARELMYAFMRYLVDGAGCSIVRCSYWDGAIHVVADGDYLTSAAAIEWRTASSDGPKSWFVVRFPSAFGTNYEVLFSFRRYSTLYNSVQVFVAPEGYDLTTGTTTVLPSVLAGSQITITNVYSSSWVGNVTPPTALTRKIWNGAVSSDSESIRFWAFQDGIVMFYFEASKLRNSPAGLTTNDDDNVLIYSNVASSTVAVDVVTYSRFYDSFDTYSAAYLHGTGAIVFELSGEISDAANNYPNTYTWTGTPNPLDGNAYPLLPIGIWSPTPAAYGRIGEMVDMWWASPNIANGSTFPASGTKTHIKLGQAIVVPWDGSSPLIS